jgi:hypothetical protein
MRIVIEVDGLYTEDSDYDEDVTATVRYLRQLQKESDDAWAEDPEDGQGGLSLSTPHMGVAARIVGVVDNRREAFAEQRGETANIIPLEDA